MFYRLRQWLRSKNTEAIDCLKYRLERVEKHNERLSDELTLLGKLVTKKENVTIERPTFLCFGGDTDKRREEAMDTERHNHRLAGYSFCHKTRDGDEIWAKY